MQISPGPVLNLEEWQLLYAIMSEQHVPFHVKRAAIQKFEAALQAAVHAAQAAQAPAPE